MNRLKLALVSVSTVCFLLLSSSAHGQLLRLSRSYCCPCPCPCPPCPPATMALSPDNERDVQVTSTIMLESAATTIPELGDGVAEGVDPNTLIVIKNSSSGDQVFKSGTVQLIVPSGHTASFRTLDPDAPHSTDVVYKTVRRRSFMARVLVEGEGWVDDEIVQESVEYHGRVYFGKEKSTSTADDSYDGIPQRRVKSNEFVLEALDPDHELGALRIRNRSTGALLTLDHLDDNEN